MTPPADLLDHATELFPEPAGALERLRARHARRRRARRLAAIGTVAAIWIALALVATGALDAGREPVPVDEPRPSVVPTLTDTKVELTAELPSRFPTDFPLPAGTRPVASRMGLVGEDTVIQVWFQVAPGSGATLRWFEMASPDAGWELGERGVVPGIWDQHVGRRGGPYAIVIGKENPDARRLIHDSDDFPGPWDLYVRMTIPPAPIGGVARGWPGPRANPAGLYSWDAQSLGRMQSRSGDGLGVAITFFLGESPPGGWDAVVVDGSAGVYRVIGSDTNGVSRESWAVDLEGTTVYLVVESPPGTTAAELAEAHAIIGSIRIEPQDRAPGFGLVFTLPEGWYS